MRVSFGIFPLYWAVICAFKMVGFNQVRSLAYHLCTGVFWLAPGAPVHLKIQRRIVEISTIHVSK